MGRKIPAKKHRGVKDPVKQQAQRFQSIKHKINAPPVDPDEQPVPRSLQRLFAFQEPAARATGKKKPKRPAEPGGGRRAGSAVAALQRLPGEAARAFSLRINSAVRALHHPDDQDYPLDLEDTDTRGEYIAAQRERRQRKHRKALAAAARAGERPPGAGSGERRERPRKAQRRALLRKEQQKTKEAEAAAARAAAARELRYERVPFGAAAPPPPDLPRPRRAPPALGAPRPGRRALLLSSLLGAGGGGGGGARSPAAAGAGGERRERARLAAVAAYRDLNKQRAAAARLTKP